MHTDRQIKPSNPKGWTSGELDQVAHLYLAGLLLGWNHRELAWLGVSGPRAGFHTLGVIDFHVTLTIDHRRGHAV